MGAPRTGLPLADAGADVVTELGQLTTLDGTGSRDPDGDTLSYEWRDAAGAVQGTSAIVSLALPKGEHVFTLIVRDGFGGAAEDSVLVTVKDTQPPAVACDRSPGRHPGGGLRDHHRVEGRRTWAAWRSSTSSTLRTGASPSCRCLGCTDLQGDVFTCAWTPPLPATTSARLRVEARDGSGNMGAGRVHVRGRGAGPPTCLRPTGP